MLRDNQKLSVTWDDTGDQPDRFPGGYYIAVVLERSGSDWVNTGRVFHVATLAELDAKLAEQSPASCDLSPFQAGRAGTVRLPGAVVDGAPCAVVSAGVGLDGPRVKVRLLAPAGQLLAGELLRLAPGEVAL